MATINAGMYYPNMNSNGDIGWDWDVWRGFVSIPLIVEGIEYLGFYGYRTNSPRISILYYSLDGAANCLKLASGTATTLTVLCDSPIQILNDTTVSSAFYGWFNKWFAVYTPPEPTDTKPVYLRQNGEWVKQNAYERQNGEWVKISGAESDT